MVITSFAVASISGVVPDSSNLNVPHTGSEKDCPTSRLSSSSSCAGISISILEIVFEALEPPPEILISVSSM